jgi:hypothetical protein
MACTRVCHIYELKTCCTFALYVNMCEDMNGPSPPFLIVTVTREHNTPL